MYELIKKNHKYKTDGTIELIGYPVKINKCEIIVYNKELIDKLIKSKLMPEFNKLVKKILIFMEEDPDSDNAENFLQELAKLYNIYLNKYEKYLSKKEKNKFMRDLRLISNELKLIINQKKYSINVTRGMRR